MRPVLVATAALGLAGYDPSSAPPVDNASEPVTPAAANTVAPVAPVEEAALPDYAPLMPGGQVNFASEQNGALTADLTAPGTAAEAMGFYERALKAQGMNPARQDGAGGSGALYSREKGRDVTISVAPGPTGSPVVGVLDKPLE